MQIVNQETYPLDVAIDTLAVRTHSLTKRFKKQTAVNKVNLEIHKGDVFGLLGPNGAGKTTIIRMLLGLIKPTEGTTEVLGFNSMHQRDEVLARVSAIVEAPALYPMLTGMNNLKAMALATGIPDADSKIAEVLEKMGLTERAKDMYKTYSLGMKQRLCIAAALLTDPQIIILDEPTNGLDPAGMAEMRQLIRDLSAQGRTVILSSHLLNEVQQVCNRVAIIQKGQIIAHGLVSDLLANKTAIRIRVRQDEWDRAWQVLNLNGYADKVTADSGYILVATPSTDGARINQLLGSQAIFAGEITPHNQSLEEYFLDLTNQQ
jgi:ABC-type multidrug transport system ATPase subunit